MNKQSSISLRDYFAGAALQGLLARSNDNVSDFPAVSLRAYRLADDMIDATITSFIYYVQENDVRRASNLILQNKELASMTFDFSFSERSKEYIGDTALLISVRKINSDNLRLPMIRLLLKNGADPNKEGRRGETATEIAEAKGSHKVIDLLEEFSKAKESK